MPSIKLDPAESIVLRQTSAGSKFCWSAAVERSAGCFLLALASPVIVASAAVITVLSRRSPLVAHLRVGRHGKPFWTVKLRSMWKSDDEEPAAVGWIEYVVAEPSDDDKEHFDPRVGNRFAAFCRRHSIDELPQLWHVACGEMSLVGPRPLTRSEIERHYGSHSAELLSVKPGITGLWQVYGRSAIRFPQRSAMDLEMVRSLNPRMYLRILLRTLPAIVDGTGAW